MLDESFEESINFFIIKEGVSKILDFDPPSSVVEETPAAYSLYFLKMMAAL